MAKMRSNDQLVEAIEKARLKAGISKRQLSRETHLSAVNITRYLKNQVRIPITAIEPIANALHVTSDMLLYDKPIKEYENCQKLNYYDLQEPQNLSLKTFGNVLEKITPDQLFVSNKVLGDYSDYKDLNVFRFPTESMTNKIQSNAVLLTKPVKINELKRYDIVVYQNCHGLDVRKFVNDKNNQTYALVPDSKDESIETYHYQYKVKFHFKILGKVVLYTNKLE